MRQALAQWIECPPMNQKVSSLIPSQGTCLRCGPGPQLGSCERQLIHVSLLHIDVSFLLSPTPPHSQTKKSLQPLWILSVCYHIHYLFTVLTATIHCQVMLHFQQSLQSSFIKRHEKNELSRSSHQIGKKRHVKRKNRKMVFKSSIYLANKWLTEDKNCFTGKALSFLKENLINVIGFAITFIFHVNSPLLKHLLTLLLNTKLIHGFDPDYICMGIIY